MTISLALCTFNGQGLVAEQLRSILAQTLPPDEIILCDDRSDDRTLEIAGNLLADSGITHQIIENPVRLGPAANFASALDRCSGELLFTCDQDDLWHPEKIQRLAGVLQENPQVTLAFCDLALMRSDGACHPGSQWQRLRFTRRQQRQFRGKGAFDHLLRYNVVNGNALAFRRALWPLIRPVPPPYLHDEWIALCCAALGEVRPVPEPLVTYRLHANQQVGGALTGWRQQIRHAAEKMQESYFRRQQQRSEALHHWLSLHQDQGISPRMIDLARERTEHMELRLAMRSASRLRRLPAIAHQWRRKGYQKFGYGWKSAVQDLVL